LCNGYEGKDECENWNSDNHITEQVNSFNYSGYIIIATNNRDLKIKMNRFNKICSTIKRTLNNKTRKDTQIKFDKAMAEPILTYESEIRTITKKTGSRN
jgi:hypothetical protein